MKKYIATLLIGTLVWASTSCTQDFEEINTDPNRIDQISPGTLLNPILYGLASFNTSRADGFTFQIMQVALPFPSANGGIHRYELTESTGNSTWNNHYKWLVNIKEMEASAIANADVNYEAISLTLKAWTLSQLTDCFGDIPMDEASRGEDGIFQPTFNTQEEVYTQIFKDLERANTLYDDSQAMIYGDDILFHNDVEKWRKFTNSLHLRLLLRVSNREEVNAFTKLAAMVNDPVTYPVFTSTAESGILQITGVTPNLSPWGRAIDFTTFRSISEFFADQLNALEDPRRAKFMTQARTSDGTTTIGYKGIPSGYEGAETQFKFIPSNHNIALVQAPMLSLILTYAEVEFIKAELAQRGYISSDAKAHYEKGVKAAMEQWDVQLPAGYFDNPAASYDGTLERIMLQKYVALYFNDTQQWFEYRRTGLPELPKNPGMENNQIMPVRYEYPVSVQINNPDNYQDAVARMGGDDINTKVWWEK
ncbi:SusD/RagB family nutrient-binding outer membrane lipoprotein [Algoriphagus aestuariicola]|uniref:SusD/RagB family nutrient-binding outer membrane lipoprotein n=1 Tax=Algoriphagus aestuariicola TaxID=1852016 RepID=A0ABS3BP15_9BACT|nr:SusD/RagB family nutrient-binding outer membrane lipoprotein [Algoriphagus aestuariicola]MBN7800903.1 SusD/RagB family nutrient-binding outer membrane lipoprotein [Algoriphagus aestuariicola]